MKEVKAAFH